LAIVKLAIDHIFEIEQAYGENIRDMLFKKLAEVLQQTSRTHDAVARAQFNEFVLILPECSKTGAVMKAERIRRLIAKQNWLENRMKITLSVGISEYPSLSSTAEGLDDNASKALNHIQEKSGDKICVYKMAENHQPEFTVDEGG
ncbi:MAG: GGDEF domain-containing protein, partial [Pseudobdellovibrionaceae bacterium]